MISTLTTTAITNKITAAAIPMHMPTTCLFYLASFSRFALMYGLFSPYGKGPPM